MSKPVHHIREELCLTRAPYREGRKPTAVKVYTVNQESKYLLVQGVPTVGAKTELLKLFGSHGDIQEVRTLDDYPSDSFTEVYLVNFKRIQSARAAKRRLDDWSFYGGILHVCYAPEYESVQETREKLQERRRAIAAKIRQHNREGTYRSTSTRSTTATTSQSETQISATPSIVHSTHNTDTIHETGHMKLTANEVPGQKSCYNGMNLNSESPSSHQDLHNQTNYNMRLHNIDDVSNQFARQSYGKTHTEPAFNNDSSHHESPGLPPETLSSFQLPPPPKQGVTSKRNSNGHSQRYGFARVPSAQVTFPADFDARLNKAEIEMKINQAKGGGDITVDSEQNHDKRVEKTMQEKINDDLKSGQIKIKSFTKQGQVPKFIPRQMQNKMKSSSKPDDKQVQKTDLDDVNKELKRNAFTLKDVQGPEDIHAVKNKGPELQTASVHKSVKEIRKHVSQFSDRNITEVPIKRQKIEES